METGKHREKQGLMVSARIIYMQTNKHKHVHISVHIYTYVAVYRMSQEEWSIFREVIVSVILSKSVYMYMCPTPNGFRDRAFSCYRQLKERQDALRRATRHGLTRVAMCIDVHGGIFENVLY
jgi:hypothetical protein